MDNPSSPDAPVEAKARFWLGLLVAGCCFALGYGITERVLTLRTNAEDPVPEAFTPLAFPGDSLQEIRARFSDDDSSLQVDVTALEAAEAASSGARADLLDPDQGFEDVTEESAALEAAPDLVVLAEFVADDAAPDLVVLAEFVADDAARAALKSRTIFSMSDFVSPRHRMPWPETSS